MKIEILAAAREDLIEGFRFYEQKEEQLGDYFLSALYADIEGLRIFAGIHAQVYRGHHRVLSNRFPFAIYYTLNDRTVTVRAVIDCRRSPSWIRRRLH